MYDVNFKQLPQFTKANHYLVCPKNYCNIQPDLQALIYKIPASKLKQRLDEVIATEPRVKLVKSDPKGWQYQYVQRSLIFRFPDIITIKYVPLGKHHSSFALLSQSKYGYYDFKVNQKRVTRWLRKLNIKRLYEEPKTR